MDDQTSEPAVLPKPQVLEQCVTLKPIRLEIASNPAADL